MRLLNVVTMLSVCLIVPFSVSCSGSGSVRLEKGITYSSPDGVDLKLDLALPARGTGKPPYPGLIYIYGSGWGWASSQSRFDNEYTIEQAAEKGYVAVTIDHRRIDVKRDGKSIYTFPMQLHDVKCAIRWMRDNAKRYRMDPNRIGVLGFSSGGHLALMAGLTNPADGLDGPCAGSKTSLAVQAIVSCSAITDMALWYKQVQASSLLDLLGGNPDQKPQEYRAASPIVYVSADDPPVLIVQGEYDDIVPIEQASLLDERLSQAGVRKELSIQKNAGHQDMLDREVVWAFLDRHLKGER